MKHSESRTLIGRITVTAFAKLSDNDGVQWTLSDLLKYMSSVTDNSRRVEEARTEYATNGKSDKYVSLKNGLRLVTWNVEKFRKGGRTKRNITKMSGLMYFDADGGKTKDDVLSSPLAPYVLAMWSSVSGNGVGGVIWAPGVSMSRFQAYWQSMFDTSGGILDESCKDAGRSNFFSFDKELWVAPGVVLGFEPSTPGAAAVDVTEYKNDRVYADAYTSTHYKNRSNPASISNRVVRLTPGVPYETPVRTEPQDRSLFFSYFISSDFPEHTRPERSRDVTEYKNDRVYADAYTSTHYKNRSYENICLERVSTWLPKEVKKGRRTKVLAMFFRNYFIARPESFSLRTMLNITNKLWERFDGDLPFSDLKSIYDRLLDEALMLGGLRPYSVPAKMMTDPSLSSSERKSLGGKYSGGVKRGAAEKKILEFIAEYAGTAKLTSSVIGAGIGVNPVNVRTHMTDEVKNMMKRKNEELNLIKTKRKRTGSFKEPEAKSDAKHQPEYESSPRVAGYAQEDNNACVEEPEFKYSFCDTLKLNIVAE
jgi:hypothetical protein